MTLHICDGNILFMKKQIANLFTYCALLCTLPVVAHAYTERETATLRVMNKAAGKVHTLKLPVGKMVEFEKLSILVRTCKQTDPFQAEDFFAFVEISKMSDGKIFSNWMGRNEPGDNPVQNPDYDVWLVRCE